MFVDAALRLCALPAAVWAQCALPFGAYWALALVYTLLGYDGGNEAGRARDAASEKNGVSKRHVALSVLRLQVGGVVSNAFFYMLVEHRGESTVRPLYVMLGVFMVDTAEYWMHRLYHTRFLYAHSHKVHHELKSPYSFGALYNDAAEGVLTSTVLAALFYAGGLAGASLS